jgi:ATP-dependent helicase/nuclease subunit B
MITASFNNFFTGFRAHMLRVSEQVGEFDGVLASDWAKQVLRRRYKSHLYSVSEFDLYVRCPIRFFFQRILHLTPLQEIEAGISAIEIGQLIHRIVYRFYADMSGGHSHGGNVDRGFLQNRTDRSQWVQNAKEKMAQIVHDELKSCNFSGVFWDKLLDTLSAGIHEAIEEPQKQGLLLSFIEREARDTDRAIPCYLHANFGMFLFPGDAHPADAGYILSDAPLRISAEDEEGKKTTIKLRGQIDRIDVEPENDQGKRYVVVYDYKTGSVPSSQNIRKGLAFQLPLYILAVREFLGESCDVVSGGYYQLKSPGEIGKKGFLGSKEAARQGYFSGSNRGLLETHDEFLCVLGEYKVRAIRTARSIAAGQFPPTELRAQDAGCSWCEYQRICRVEHQGAGRL